MITENVLFALGLTLFAGLATTAGSLMAFFSRKFKPSFLCASLGFSAGVMIYVAFVEIFVKANESLGNLHGEKTGYWFTVLAFFAGIALIAVVDRLVPSFENPHEMKDVAGSGSIKVDNSARLHRLGLFSALAIGIHNFPEGMATFMGALHDPAIGISIAAAIAIHNIPEGIAVSVPVYYSTGSRKKAFWLSFLSGFAEPVGAVAGYFILRLFFDPAGSVFGLVFSAVAGIMVYISLDELLPAAEEYGRHHVAIGGVMAGMLVMALSLLLLK